MIQLSKFRSKNWVTKNNESRGIYSYNNDIKFATLMIRSNLCDYSDAYILVSETITITWEGADDAAKQADEINKGVIFKNISLFTEANCNNNTKVDNVKDKDVVMPMYNLIKYSDNCSKISRNLWIFRKDDLSD